MPNARSWKGSNWAELDAPFRIWWRSGLSGRVRNQGSLRPSEEVRALKTLSVKASESLRNFSVEGSKSPIVNKTISVIMSV